MKQCVDQLCALVGVLRKRGEVHLAVDCAVGGARARIDVFFFGRFLWVLKKKNMGSKGLGHWRAWISADKVLPGAVTHL